MVIIFHFHLTEYIFLKELYRIVIIARMLCIHIPGQLFFDKLKALPGVEVLFSLVFIIF